MNKPRLVAAFGAALLIGGCSASSPTSPPAIGPTPPPATQTVAAATAIPSGPRFSFALPSFSFPVPSFDVHGAPQLEATIPDTVAGQSIEKVSTDFARLESALGGNSAENRALGDWIRSLGDNPSDVRAAAGFSTGVPKISILAIQIAGTDSTKMLTTLRLALRTQDITPTETTVGSKAVLQFSDPTEAGTTSFAYVHGDVVYVTQSTDAAAAQSAVAALP